MLFLAKVFLSVAAIQYGFIPPIVDLADSHVFHPDWPPHARFHLVWPLVSGFLFSSYVLIMVWYSSWQNQKALKHASVIGCVILTAFFVATITSPGYGGSLSDLDHPMKVFGLDRNVFAFSLASIFQLAGTVMVWRNDKSQSES